MSDRTIALLMGLLIVLLATVLVVVLASRGSSSHPGTAAANSPVPTSSASIGTTPTACHSVNGLPDRTCTPGMVDPRVTQDTILTTICVSGYTAKVRPSTEYTNGLKRQQIAAYGYSDTNLADYEEDHLIPLEIGGHPTDPKNLWPEPLTGAYAATKKDGVENSLHNKVCDGLMTLAAAQRAIATDWETAA